MWVSGVNTLKNADFMGFFCGSRYFYPGNGILNVMYESPIVLIVGGVFAFVVLVFGIVSAVLQYHWKRYGLSGGERLGIPMAAYYGVAGLLFAAMLILGFIALGS